MSLGLDVPIILLFFFPFFLVHITAQVFIDGRMLAAARYQYGIDGTPPDVSALGKPDYTFVLKPGDMLYVPRGAIHMTSTEGLEGTSVHFTTALPMDHQSLSWGVGLSAGPGVEQHPYLEQGMVKAAEQLVGEHMDLRRSIKPLGNATNMNEEMRNMLHRVVDELIDGTDFTSLVKSRFAEWDIKALQRIPLDPNII